MFKIILTTLALVLVTFSTSFAEPIITSQLYPVGSQITTFEICFDNNPNWCFGPSPKSDNRGRAYLSWDLGPYEFLIESGDHTVTVKACQAFGVCGVESAPLPFSLTYVAVPVINFNQ